MGAIITGEAVALELRPASFGARALGLLIDVVVHAALLAAALLTVVSAAPDLDPAAFRALALVAVVFFLVVVPVAVETISRGLSLGKLALGLRIVRDDGGAIRFRHALIRGLTGFLEIYATLGGLAIAVALFSDKSRRLGDVMAGTYALRRRVPLDKPVLAAVPAHLRQWAEVADIGRVPDGTARRAAMFVRQAGQLSPLSREETVRSLATELSHYVAPLPPAGTNAYDFVAAVLAERRARETARLAREHARSQALGARLRKLPFTD
ncbi:RDD family protein [Pseudarthrobacter sp. J64]|uniref:RDD family protein n=1 Tax=Pseudarthrobacter sp. J64 TaxID=3116485 RepID=UPI002E81B251|nr:RDD family protein [Pseudarthrobacter sp. J64]MEE2570889.1 RDD family protein [Pseudarthrobacter sp. J64]